VYNIADHQGGSKRASPPAYYHLLPMTQTHSLMSFDTLSKDLCVGCLDTKMLHVVHFDRCRSSASVSAVELDIPIIEKTDVSARMYATSRGL
jgi:hypothetical protein